MTPNKRFKCDLDSFINIISKYERSILLTVSRDLALSIHSLKDIRLETLENLAYVIAYCTKGDRRTLYIYNVLSSECYECLPPKDFESRIIHPSFPIVGRGVKCIRDLIGGR
ncbi:MAG TPA: hypothetical protein EYH40_04305 [Desulfurococcales archaeon]|nr:hypothetical protein [Desulfurococcales archaeon]